MPNGGKVTFLIVGPFKFTFQVVEGWKLLKKSTVAYVPFLEMVESSLWNKGSLEDCDINE